MRGLRTPVDQIRFVDPHLASNFAAINRELVMVTLALSSKTSVYGRDSDTDAVDAFGDLVVRQRKLFDDRERLISQIQALPGFHAFLKPPSFDTLRSAARHGPVIIINHSGWRSDIIILLYNSPPSDYYTKRLLCPREQIARPIAGCTKGGSRVEYIRGCSTFCTQGAL